jgi:GDP-L-fucose synthase
MEKDAKIYVAGHKGMVGSAICRALQRNGYTNIITRSHKELDLCRQVAVEEFFSREKPDYVFLAAAKVGGIMANSEALADFMYENMILEMNVIHAAWQNGCKKLMFLGSSCIYPRMAPQPMKESCLLTSELEKTNEAYALAKISGLKYCEFLNRQYGTDYISVMPTNLYGPNDNYHPTHSHVLPALIRRFHEAKVSGAKEVVCWGTGTPLREFLYVDDLAEEVKQMKEAGICTYAAHLEGKNSYDEEDYRKASAFLIGNEGNGLRDEVADQAQVYIRIPMKGQVESLNAAVATAILTFEAARQRR